MGSPLSPVLAMLICMYYESKYVKRYSDDRLQTTSSMRYIDDLLGVFVHHKDLPLDFVRQEWLTGLSHIYHRNMELEEELK